MGTLALAAVMIASLAMRLVDISQPMRLDEARTVLDYAIRPLGDALSNYRVPNNHLLHTLLVWTSVRLFGDAEWAIRMPALIAGLAGVAATYVVVHRMANPLAALFAAALVAVLPSLVLYSTNARGYTMICLASVMLVGTGDKLACEDSLRVWLGFAVIIALGMYTAPVMLYPAGAVCFWLMVERVRRRGWRSAIPFLAREIAALAAAATMTLLLYLPVLRRFGVAAITGNKFVAPIPWHSFFAVLPHLPYRLRLTIGLGIPAPVLAPLLLFGLLPLLSREPFGARLRSLAICTIGWCAVLMAATRHPPPGRVFLFLAMLLCMYTGIGLAIGTMALSRRSALRGPAIAMVLAAIAICGGYSVATAAVINSNEAVGLPDGQNIARFLLDSARTGDRVIYMRDTGPEIDYYLYRLAGRRLAAMEDPPQASRMIVVLNDRERQTISGAESLYPDILWNQYATPTLVRRLPAARLYIAPRRP